MVACQQGSCCEHDGRPGKEGRQAGSAALRIRSSGVLDCPECGGKIYLKGWPDAGEYYYLYRKSCARKSRVPLGSIAAVTR